MFRPAVVLTLALVLTPTLSLTLNLVLGVSRAAHGDRAAHALPGGTSREQLLGGAALPSHSPRPMVSMLIMSSTELEHEHEQ